MKFLNYFFANVISEEIQTHYWNIIQDEKMPRDAKKKKKIKQNQTQNRQR